VTDLFLLVMSIDMMRGPRKKKKAQFTCTCRVHCLRTEQNHGVQ